MKKEFIAIDIESSGLSAHKDKLHGIAVSQEEDCEEYYPAWQLPAWIAEKLADPNIVKIAFNARFDLGFLAAKGFTINGPIIDPMLMAMLVNENTPRGLKFLSEKYLGADALSNKHSLDKAMNRAGVKNVGGLCALDLADPEHPYTSVIARYAKEDIRNTLKLMYVFENRLKEIHTTVTKRLGMPKSPLTYLKEEVVPVESVLLAMEVNGVRINTDAIQAVKDSAEQKKLACITQLNLTCKDQIVAIEEELFEKALATKKSDKGKAKVERSSDKYKTRFSWESSRHLGKLLYERFDLSPALVRTTDKGSPLTTETYLKFLYTAVHPNHAIRPVLKLYGTLKKAQKIASTYTGDSKRGISSHLIYNDKGEPYIHGSFPQTTNTGRLAPKKPNLANLPRNSPVKRFFIPSTPDHVFVYFDFSQIELRVAAHLSRDQNFVDAYTLGIDLHKLTASKIFGCRPEDVNDIQRQVGKTCNFLLIYAGSAKRLMQELHDKNGLDFSLEQCQSFRENFFEHYREYRAYLQKELEFVKRYQVVVSETGRVRRLPDIVYGDFLNWREKRFTGPEKLVEALKLTPYEKLQGEELFWRANKKYAHATKQTYNYKPQHLGSVITKRSMVELFRRGFKIVNQVHDAIIIELPKTQLGRTDEIKHVLENTYTLTVPIKAEMKLLNSFDEADKHEPNGMEAQKNLPK